MADLPLHEAVVALLRHWGDPSFVPPKVYELNFGEPNQLFYFLILPLAYVVSVTTATKIIVALTLLLFPPAAARFADYLGVTRWTAVLVSPMGLGWMFFWGLLANLVGFTAFLAALPSLDRMCEKPTRRNVGIACAWVVLLHFAHDLMALMAGGAIFLFLLLSWRGWRDNLLRAIPGVLVLVLAVGSRALDARHASSHGSRLPPFLWQGPWKKLTLLPGVVYSGHEAWVRGLIFGACLFPMGMFALERWRNRTPRAATWRERLHHFRFEILAGWLIVGYFAAPENMRSTTLIYQRFMAPAWAILTVTLAARSVQGAPWRLPRLLTALMPLAPLLTSWPRFQYSDEVYRDLDACIDHMAGNSTYAVLELGPTNDYWLFGPITGGGHIVARLGGRGFFDFTESPASPVRLKRKIIWTRSYERMDSHSYRMYPSFDLTLYHYAILHTPVDNVARLAMIALQPETRFVFHQGEWTVLESTLPQIPPDSREPPAPDPPPLNLRERSLKWLEETQHEALQLPPEAPPAGQEGP
jgi:hypothetical protein